MKRIRLLGVALMAVFALGVIAAASASAQEPTKVLPEPTEAKPLMGTSKSGPGTLLTVGKNEVTCKKDTDTFSATTPNLGTFHATFEECKTVVLGQKLTCTGVGDKEGLILLLGTVHYWLALLSAKLVAALVFLFEEFHFTCKNALAKALVLVKGCAAALAEPTEKLTKVTKDIFKEEKSGVPDIKEVLPSEAKSEIKCITETNVNETKFEESAQTGTDENEAFKQGGAEVEVLLMN